MARRQADRYVVSIEDVNGTFARFIHQAPKKARQYVSTAVFLTAGAVQRGMEAKAPLGPEGEGLTPGQHIKFDIEHRGRSKALWANVGIYEADQALVALYNEYSPNEQPFMRPATEAEAGPFETRVKRALEQCERDLAIGTSANAK